MLKWSLALAGRLGGVTVDAQMAAARSKSAVAVAHRTAAQRLASGAKTRAKIVVIAMPQSAPSGHNRPLYSLPAVGFCQKITGHPHCRQDS